MLLHGSQPKIIFMKSTFNTADQQKKKHQNQQFLKQQKPIAAVYE
jgi:hypothetical protein